MYFTIYRDSSIFEDGYSLWNGTLVLTLLEIVVMVSCAVWMSRQSALLIGKEIPLLSRANGVVVWFWGSLWRGLVGR